MEALFKPGDIVCAKVNPNKPLKIKYFVRRIYYCDILDLPNEKEEVYFEREIEVYTDTKL